MNLINGYIKNHEYLKLDEYVKELLEEQKNEDNFVITGNQIIDLILHANKEQIKQLKINIRYDVKLKDIEPIAEIGFNVVFSNILENAIDSCKRGNGHFIKIKLERNNSLIILKIINYCAQKNNDFSTMKTDTEYHGYGIKNIKKIANKYNGSAILKYDSDKQIFITTVIFNSL